MHAVGEELSLGVGLGPADESQPFRGGNRDGRRRRRIGGALPLPDKGAFIRFHQSLEKPSQCGLARTGKPHHSDDFAVAQLQSQFLYREVGNAGITTTNLPRGEGFTASGRVRGELIQ